MEGLKRLAAAFEWLPRSAGTYVVGGSVRDVLLGRPAADVDMVVMDHPLRFARKLAEQHGGRWVELGKAGKTIIRVVLGKTVVDISPLSGDPPTIAADLSRRDFTVNALAYDLAARELVDTAGGITDMADRRIRMVSEAGFEADPLRLLRAYRIAAQLGFHIAPPTASAIGRHAARITTTAGERVRHEIFGLLRCRSAAGYIEQMGEKGLLFQIFPELAALRQTPRPHSRYHAFDTYQHTIAAFHHLEGILARPETVLTENIPSVTRRFTPDRSARLKCAMLLHDMGKPSTLSTTSDDDVHYYGHDQNGAAMMDAVSQRLKLSKEEADTIKFVIGQHLRPLMLFQADARGTLTRKGTTRFFIRCRGLTPDILLHSMADMRGKKDRANGRCAAFFKFANHLLTLFFRDFKPASKAPPLITGNDLMASFNLSPSPLFKEILSLVEEERLSGHLGSRQAALRFTADYLEHNRR